MAREFLTRTTNDDDDNIMNAIVNREQELAAYDANIDSYTEQLARMITATVAGGGSLTEIPTSACSLATSSVDQLKGRVVIFLYNTTNGDLRSEVAKINGSTASATPTLTVTTLTSVPQDGDSLIIV